LCSLLSEFGQVSSELKIFWQETLEKICLGGAMRLCHVAGVVIP